MNSDDKIRTIISSHAEQIEPSAAGWDAIRSGVARRGGGPGGSAVARWSRRWRLSSSRSFCSRAAGSHGLPLRALRAVGVDERAVD